MKNNIAKVALITGSSRGLGRETARVLARNGYTVVLHGKDPIRLEKTRKEFADQGLDVHSYAANVTILSEVQDMFQWIKSELGTLDILVTNASLTMEAEFMKTDPEAFRMVVDSHIYGSIFPIRVMLEEIKANKGSIILISSLAGLHGLPRFSAYCTGKMALTAFWQSLRIEQKNTGLHLGLIHLAFVRNDPDKTLINASGTQENMPPRPAKMQLSQTVVANEVFKVIVKRKNRTVMSVYGKAFGLLIKIVPGAVHHYLSRFFKT